MKYLNNLAFIVFLAMGLGQNNWIAPLFLHSHIKYGYDSNPLRLSEDEISFSYSDSENILTNGSDEVYSNFLSFYNKLSYAPKLINNRSSRISFSLKCNYYLEQDERTNSSINFNFNQSLGKYKNFYFNYFLMPDYYLREYRDNDMIINDDFNYEDLADSLQSSYFTTEKIKLGYEHPVNRNKEKISLEIFQEKQIFNDIFTEFDLDINGFGVKYYNQNYSIFYGYSNADNITFSDGSFSTSYMDRGYIQHQLSIRFTKKISKEVSFGIASDLYNRIYSSDIYNDNLHRTREHNDLSISAWYSFFIDDYKCKISFSNRNRITSSSFSWVEDLKSFERYAFSYTVFFKKIRF